MGKIAAFLTIVIGNNKKEVATGCVLEIYNNHPKIELVRFFFILVF